jgi:hypothetical protein
VGTDCIGATVLGIHIGTGNPDDVTAADGYTGDLGPR